jgi:hypothetical protein
MVWALLTACTSPGTTDAEASPEPGLTGGERQFEDTGLPAGPAWSLEEVAARLAEVLSEPAPTSGGMALSYEELMSHRTLSCPQAEMPTLDAWVVWASQGAPCTTEEGWSWYGLANGAGGCMTGDGIDQVDVGALVSFEATDPQGQVFAAGGTFYQGCSFSESEGACVGALTGAFHYPAASGWLADGVEAALYIDDTWEGDRHELLYDGGVTRGGVSLAFGELRVTPESVEGRIALRDPTDYWHEMTLTADSGGCGQMSWRGEAEGEVCIDASAWNAPIPLPERACKP